MQRLRRPPWTWERFWFALLAVLMVLGLAALWFFPPWLFEPRVRLIPLALYPGQQADYRAEPRLAAIPGISLSLIRQALQDRQPQAQAETVLRQLDTPIPTATVNRPPVLPTTPMAPPAAATSLPGVTMTPTVPVLTPTPTPTLTIALSTATLSPTAEVSPTADQRPTRTPKPTQTPPPTETPRPTLTSLPPSPTPRPPSATAPAYPPPATPLPPTSPTPTLGPYPPP